MNELDLFRDFRRGVAPPTTDARGRASALLAAAVAGAHTTTSHRGRLVLLAAAALVAFVGSASAFSTVRDFILDSRDDQSVDYCIGSALRSKLISFRSADGVPLHGLLLGSGRNGIVLYGPGGNFRGSLCDWLPFGRTLARRGYRVLTVDTRPAPPIPRATATHYERDVVGAERELLRRGATRVLVGGGFVGGTAAMTAAALIPRTVLAGVVVLSPARRFGVMDSAAAARRIAAPSFIGVGRRDSPFVDEARRLYAASASKRKELVVVPSSGNGTQLLERSWAPASFRARLLAFIADSFKSS